MNKTRSWTLPFWACQAQSNALGVVVIVEKSERDAICDGGFPIPIFEHYEQGGCVAFLRRPVRAQRLQLVDHFIEVHQPP